MRSFFDKVLAFQAINFQEKPTLYIYIEREGKRERGREREGGREGEKESVY